MGIVNRTVYLEELKHKLEHYYFATRGGAPAEMHLAGIMGYVEAGVDLGVVTRAEQQAVIEQAYERVFGVKREGEESPPANAALRAGLGRP